MGSVEGWWAMKRLAACIVLGPVAVAVGLYCGLPLILVIADASKRVAPSGFGRGARELASLAAKSVVIAIIPAILSASFCTVCSLLGFLTPTFRRFYHCILLILAFTNPVFFVLSFAVLLAEINPTVAVMLASSYIALPLGAIIIEAAVCEYPVELATAARSLGASELRVVLGHVLPSIQHQLTVAVFMIAVYVMGFYLVPTYVGLGRVSTLSTAIHAAANQTGDWVAACQLSTVLLAGQIALLIAWQILAYRRREAGRVA